MLHPALINDNGVAFNMHPVGKVLIEKGFNAQQLGKLADGKQHGWILLKVKRTTIKKVLRDPTMDVNIMGGENLLFTGAKAYSKPNNFWLISGYAGDQRDLLEVILKLRKEGLKI